MLLRVADFERRLQAATIEEHRTRQRRELVMRATGSSGAALDVAGTDLQAAAADRNAGA